MNTFDDFACIRIINLAHRGDRRVEMADQLARVGLAYDSPNVSLFRAVRPVDPGGFESTGARGCFLSHLEILRQAQGTRNILIFEDDLNFARNIGATLRPALHSLPPSWGIFYGGCVSNAVSSGDPLREVHASTPLGTSYFVGFNGQVIDRLVPYLEAILTRPSGDPEGGPMHVDGAYSRFRADNPDVRTFVAVPELGYQRPSRTDIHALKWFDRAPLVRELVQFIRRQRARSR
jgi:glycosyl transferase, family 25